MQTTSFVIRKSYVVDYKGEYCRLIEPTTQQGKEDMFLAGKNRYSADQSNFSQIPGSPVAYWVSDRFMSIFQNPSLFECTISDGQNKTGDNARFVREFWEVSNTSIGINKKWLFYAKGAVIVSGTATSRKLLIGQKKHGLFIKEIVFAELYQNTFGIKLESHGV